MNRKELEKDLSRLEEIIGVKIARPKLEKGDRLGYWNMCKFATYGGITGFENELEGILKKHYPEHTTDYDSYYILHNNNIIGKYNVERTYLIVYDDKDIITKDELDKKVEKEEKDNQVSKFIKSITGFLCSDYDLLSFDEMIDIIQDLKKKEKKGK